MVISISSGNGSWYAAAKVSPPKFRKSAKPATLAALVFKNSRLSCLHLVIFILVTTDQPVQSSRLNKYRFQIRACERHVRLRKIRGRIGEYDPALLHQRD